VVRRASDWALSAALGAGLLAVLGALVCLSGCRNKRLHDAPAGSSKPRLAPLAASGWLVDLELPGFGKAALAVPLGATGPRPIVIALHGSADRPEWVCGAFRSIAGPAPFVLCPRGVERSDFSAPDLRYSFGPPETTARELRAALTELKRKFGAYVAPGPVVFAGFEIGADQAAWIARQEPAFFARVVLVAPDKDTWPSSLAATFGREGGQRALFVCGSPCRAEFELKAELTRHGGAEARTLFLGDRVATLDSATVKLLAGAWAWLEAPSSPRLPENLAGSPLTAPRPVKQILR